MITYLPCGKIVNKVKYNIRKVKLLRYDPIIQLHMDYFINMLPDINGIFFNNKIFLDFTQKVLLDDGSVTYISNKEHLDILFNENKKIIFNLDTIKTPIFKKTYLTYYNMFTTGLSSDIFIKEMLSYIESYFMYNIHKEHTYVGSDPLGISNDVILDYDHAAKQCHIEYMIDINKVFMSDTDRVDDIFNILLDNVLIDYDETYLSSLSFNFKNNGIVEIIEYASPAERRFYINCEYKHVKDIEDSESKKDGNYDYTSDEI